MQRVRVTAFTISLDGFAAGPDQTIDQPLGRGGEELHRWFMATRSFKEMHGEQGGVTTGIDAGYADRALEGYGAYILGRNMFGPVRGSWDGSDWKGWWGDNPPFHAPTFVLTHHPRDPIVMEGGTTFHFVTGGIEAALEQARAAAGELDVEVGGGVSTLRQYLTAGLIDEMHIAVAPILLGRGESPFGGLDLPALGIKVAGVEAGEAATHLRLIREPKP